MDVWVPLLLVVVLIAANAIFVAAEFALVTVDRAQVRTEAEAGDRAAGGIYRALQSLSTQLSGAQVGITITSLVVGWLAEPAIASLLTGPLQALGVPEAAALPLALGLALLIATVTQMVFGELIPKNWAIAQPRRVAAAVAPAQRGFTAFARPLISVTNGHANALLRRMGVQPVEELSAARGAAELQSLIRHSAVEGTLDSGTAALLDRTLRFGDRSASDVMTPRTEVQMVEAGDTLAAVLAQCERTGFSRFPVIGRRGRDEVLGVVTLRDAVSVPLAERAEVRAHRVMTEVRAIPETLPLDDVLPLVRGGDHLVLVVDEYGGTAGIVTLEDLVEELVGEVADEHDRTGLREQRQPDGSWLLSGLLRPEEARERGVPVPDDPRYDTIAGFVVARLGRLPAVGDEVEAAGWRLQVAALDGRRIDRLAAAPGAPQPGGAPLPGPGEADGE